MYFDDLTAEEIRIIRAKYDDFYFENIDSEKATATTVGANGTYNTSLNFCTCQDFQKRRKPCKHIYRLSYKLGKFDLYDNPEQEEIALKINKITDLVTAEKLKDIYYKKRNSGQNYSLEKNKQTNFLEQIEIIKLYDIPITERINREYKAPELKNILKNKYEIKGLKKPELIELFANDEELAQTLLPTDQYKVELLCSDENKYFFIECLNYRIYNQLQNRDSFNENSYYYNFEENIENIEESSSTKVNVDSSSTIDKPVNENTSKSFGKAILLCLFLGVFGTHKFYLKQNKSAYTMLAITLLSGGRLLPITMLWAFIDLIILIKKYVQGNNNKNNENNYN